jgi:hypothetical protein
MEAIGADHAIKLLVRQAKGNNIGLKPSDFLPKVLPFCLFQHTGAAVGWRESNHAKIAKLIAAGISNQGDLSLRSQR